MDLYTYRVSPKLDKKYEQKKLEKVRRRYGLFEPVC